MDDANKETMELKKNKKIKKVAELKKAEADKKDVKK
jgi:hypothetical protein